MSMAPKIYIEFETEGADSATKALDDVNAGFDDVADAAAKAAKAQDDAGKAAEKTTGRARKLWEMMKANAGAASGAAGAFATVSAILNSDMSPAAKTATGVAQGLAAGLSAFGPIGQLAGAAVSFISSSLIPLIDGMSEAEEEAKSLSDQWRTAGETGSFFAKTIGQMAAKVQDLGKEITDYQRRYEGLASLLGTQAELIPESFEATGVALARLREETEAEIKGAQETLRAYRRDAGNMADPLGRAIEGAALGAIRGRIAQGQEELKRIIESQERLTKAFKPEEAAAATPAASSSKGGAARARLLTEQEILAEITALRVRAEAAVEEKIDEVRDYFAANRKAADEARAARLLSLAEARAQTNARILQIEVDQERKAAEEIQALRDETFGRMGMMLESFSTSMAQAAAASLLFGDSFGEAAKGALKALAAQAGGEALMEGARALAALAKYFATPWNVGLLASAKTHGLAAAGFAAIAGGAAIGANAIGGASAGGASAGGSAPPTARQLSGPGGGREAGPTTINTNFVANGPMSRVLAREYRAGNDDLRRRAATGAAA